MSRYGVIALMFLANNEIVSLLALTIMVGMAIWDIMKEAAKRC